MDRINSLPALTQDEVRVGAWAEVREPCACGTRWT